MNLVLSNAEALVLSQCLLELIEVEEERLHDGSYCVEGESLESVQAKVALMRDIQGKLLNFL